MKGTSSHVIFLKRQRPKLLGLGHLTKTVSVRLSGFEGPRLSALMLVPAADPS